MKKRFLGGMIALVLALVLGVSAYGAEPANACGDSVNWTLDSAGTLTISGTGVMRDFNSGSDTPWAKYKQKIRSVCIEDGVTSVGEYAFFDCPALTGVTLGKDVESIGTMAFYGCGALTHVTMGDGLTTIGQYAFGFCAGLTNVTLPGHVTDIGDAAFTTCTGLTDITIPDSVTKIGAWAFYGCSGLTDVYYGGTAADWAKIAIDESNDPLLNAALHCPALAAPAVKSSYVGASGKPRLTWSAVAGASKYEVYRSTSENGTYSKVFTTTGTSYTNTSAKAGSTYYYKVKAISTNSAANSAYSAVSSVTCRCAQPVVKTATNTSGKPRLTWSAVAGASKYEVYRSTSENGTYTRAFTTTGTSYTNTSAKAGTTYYYKVKAISTNSAANSAYSAVSSVTCWCARPVVKIATNTSGKPRLTWSAVAGASKYEVYRSTSENGTYSKVFTTTGTSYTHVSAKAGSTYYYKVKAISTNSAANSAYSVVSSVTCRLAQPVVKIATNTSGKPRLTWSAVAGASKYEVYRSTSENGTYSKVFTTTGTSYTHVSAKAGSTYYYKVKAISSTNSAANSTYSAVRSIRTK